LKTKRGLTLLTSICLVSVLAALALMSACAQPTPTPTPTPVTGTIELKFNDYFPPPAKQCKICEEFITDMDKLSDGRVKISFYPGGSLLTAPATFDGVVEGVADIGLAHVEYTPGRMPVTEVCDLPLGSPSAWVSNHVANDFYNEFKPEEWDQVHVLWLHTCPPNVMITTKPVYKMEDLKGLTIRAPGSVGDTVKALGATPAPTPVMEVYDAMSKGVLDGVNIPFETLKTFKFAEVAEYVTSSWQVGNLYTFYVVMNKDSWNKLPQDVKDIFNELSGVYQERFALMWNEIDFAGKDFAVEQGVEFIDLSPEETLRWQKAVEPVAAAYVDKMVAEGYSKAEVEGWIKFLRERIDYWTAKQIEWQLKSVTGPAEMRS